MLAAQGAAGAWRADVDARRAALRAAASAALAAADDLAAILTAEQGKPLKAAAFEVAEMARWLEYSAGLDLPRAVLQDDEQGHAELVHRPLGVVAAITPWNYPLLLAGVEAGARAAGRQHRGAQAVAVHAAVHPGPGPHPGRGAAARRAQRGQRRR